MGLKELSQVIRHSVAVTLLVFVPLWLIVDFHHALGLAFGGLWSSANLWALKGLIEAIFQSRGFWSIAWFAQLKIPLLYGIGALVLLKVPLSVGAGIVGFHIPFVLIVVEAVYWQQKQTRTPGTA